MNLSKIQAQAVKSADSTDSKSLSIESMKKLMGGGAYCSHCCVPNMA
ncbi:MAG: hypothetical protein AAFV95_27170 [Bacteroidota bacterium]